MKHTQTLLGLLILSLVLAMGCTDQLVAPAAEDGALKVQPQTFSAGPGDEGGGPSTDPACTTAPGSLALPERDGELNLIVCQEGNYHATPVYVKSILTTNQLSGSSVTFDCGAPYNYLAFVPGNSGSYAQCNNQTLEIGRTHYVYTVQPWGQSDILVGNWKTTSNSPDIRARFNDLEIDAWADSNGRAEAHVLDAAVQVEDIQSWQVTFHYDSGSPDYDWVSASNIPDNQCYVTYDVLNALVITPPGSGYHLDLITIGGAIVETNPCVIEVYDWMP